VNNSKKIQAGESLGKTIKLLLPLMISVRNWENITKIINFFLDSDKTKAPADDAPWRSGEIVKSEP
jgi:hypothetical protein